METKIPGALIRISLIIVRQPLLERSHGKGDLMLEPFSREKRNRTFLLLAAFVVFAIAAGVIGISDNAVGISLVLLAAASLVLAVAHPWSTSVQYRRLTVASAWGFVVGVIGIVVMRRRERGQRSAA